MIDGKVLHTAFKERLQSNKSLPLHLRHFEDFLARIATSPGEKSIEQQIALDGAWQPTSWFAKETWLRVISDLTQLNGAYAVCWDWKTGKRYDDFTQLELNAAITMHLAKEINTVKMAFFWTQTKQIAHKTITRAQLPEFWGEILKRVNTYTTAHENKDFPPKPNPFCTGCAVTACQYWKARK